MVSVDDKPVRRPDGRYDNVDFRKAVGFKLPTVKASYLRRDVLLFVRTTRFRHIPLSLLNPPPPGQRNRLHKRRTTLPLRTPSKILLLPHIPDKPPIQANRPRRLRLLQESPRNRRPRCPRLRPPTQRRRRAWNRDPATHPRQQLRPRSRNQP